MVELDIVTENIKVNHGNHSKHSSGLGIILSIIVCLIGIGFIVYSIIELFDRSNPFSNVNVKTLDDAGIYELSSKSLFHMIGFLNLRTNEIYHLDEEVFQILGEYRVNKLSLNTTAVYEYKFCSWERDAYGIETVLEGEKLLFEQHLCINKYKNLTTGESIVLTKENRDTFPYPRMDHGMYSSTKALSASYYTITIKFCGRFDDNFINKDKCSEAKIEEFKKYFFIGYSLKFIENQVDVTNYASPVSKVLRQKSGFFYSLGSTFIYLDFNSFTFNSDESLMFENYKSDTFYYFEKTRDLTTNYVSQTDEILALTFYLNNQRTQYFRRYKKAQEALADISGFTNFCYIIASVLNYFSYKYQIVYNTAKTFLHNKFYFSDFKYNNNQNDYFKHVSTLLKVYTKNNLEHNNLLSESKCNIKSENHNSEVSKFKLKQSNDNNNIYSKENKNEIIHASRKSDKCNEVSMEIDKQNVVKLKERKDSIQSKSTELDITNIDFSLLSRLKYIVKNMLLMKSKEDIILQLRNDIINERNFINQFFELIKLKRFLDTKMGSIFMHDTKSEVTYSDIVNFY